MKKRLSRVQRKTKETDISVKLNLDGEGKTAIDTGIPFFDHMLELFGKHGLFDLEIRARGDLAVDYHHTVEDLGICLGQAILRALGGGEGIVRYGSVALPMDEALAQVAVDIGGRSFLVYNPKLRRIKIGDFHVSLFKEFFRALTAEGRFALHVNVFSGEDVHHIVEAIFKGLGRALREAVEIDPRVRGVPSTKGQISNKQ